KAVIDYLIARYPRSRFYDRMYGACYEHHRDGRYGLVAYEQFGNRSVLFWDGWRPFVFSNAVENKAKSRRGKPAENTEANGAKVQSTLTFLRGSIDVEEILRNACDRCNKLTWAVATAEEQAKNRFVIYFVPHRGDDDGDHGHGNNGLAWYQQPMYRL